MKKDLNVLSTRSGFNIALRYFKIVNKFIKRFEKKENLADIVNEALENKDVEQYQFAPILNALLIDKYSYYAESMNLKSSFDGDLSTISSVVESWDKVDLVISYFHPQLGQTLINPKSKESLQSVGNLKEMRCLLYMLETTITVLILSWLKASYSLKSLINGEKVSLKNQI